MKILKSSLLKALFLCAIISLNFVKACACIDYIPSYHVGIGYYIWPIAALGTLLIIEAIGFWFLINYKKNNIKLWKAITYSIIFPAISIGLGGLLVNKMDVYNIWGLIIIFLCFLSLETIIIKNLLKINRSKSFEASLACNCVFLLLIMSMEF